MKIYVGNLPFSTEVEQLIEHFAPYGDVKEVKLITDRETGRLRGYGFVEMASGGQAAIEELHGKSFHGRPLVVAEGRAGAAR